MDIFLEALYKYKKIIDIKGDNIYNDDNISEEEKNELLLPILTSYEKIDSIIDEIKTTIEMGITHLTINKRNSYFYKHGLSKDDITEIKINMRRIKNRYYQQDSRYRKNESSVNC
jgi:hypothetical protein